MSITEKESTREIVAAVRGTNASNFIEWFVLVPIFIVAVFALLGYIAYFAH